MNLSKELAARARKNGICQEWHDKLLSLNDKDAMCEMYLRGIDFCISNNYPGNDFIRSHFKGVIEKHGVFLDDAVKVENKPKCVCLGTCSGRFDADGFNTCEVFVKDDSEIAIVAKENSFVMVDIFDNATVMIHAHDRAKVCVNRYGGTVQHCADGYSTIKIREKNKKTY